MSIKIENLTVKRSGKVIIDDLSLELPAQGIIGLSGPSGCGKTTLLHTLCGLIRPQAGQISGLGKSAVVFQEDRLLPWLTASQNIELVSHDTAKTQAWLRKMMLADRADFYPNQLSGGMKRRVALARALAVSADLLLMDEPFNGMDQALKEKLFPLIKAAAAKKPVLFISHDLDELEALSDQLWWADGPPLGIFPE